MKSVTVSPSRPQLDRQANGKASQYRPSLRSGKLNAEKKKPSETLTERVSVKYNVSIQLISEMI